MIVVLVNVRQPGMGASVGLGRRDFAWDATLPGSQRSGSKLVPFPESPLERDQIQREVF
jgi:hypothetical protein